MLGRSAAIFCGSWSILASGRRILLSGGFFRRFRSQLGLSRTRFFILILGGICGRGSNLKLSSGNGRGSIATISEYS